MVPTPSPIPHAPDRGLPAAHHVVALRTAARRWVEALPVGNGHRGASCWGTPGGERLDVVDVTAWSGPHPDPLATARARDPRHLADVRAALAAGDVRTAEHRARDLQTSWAQAYLPLGTLTVDVLDATGNQLPEPADGGRELDLRTATVTHRWTAADGTHVAHATWVDLPTGLLVHALAADRPVSLRVRASSLLRAHDDAARPLPPRGERPDDAPTLVDVRDLPVDVAPGHETAAQPVRHAPDGRTSALVVRAPGSLARADGDVLDLEPATHHTLVVATATSRPPRPLPPGTEPDPVARALAHARTAAGTDAARLAARLHAAHTVAHGGTYDRTTLRLGSPPPEPVPTDALLREGASPTLVTLAVHLGRYLLAASCRPGGLPPNLQGMWNAELPGPWSSAYTLNVNLQAALWPAGPGRLDESLEPVLDLLERIAAGPGAEAARTLYGARGWVAHHNSDAWGHAAPVGAGHGDPSWAQWDLGGVWLVCELWRLDAFAPGTVPRDRLARLLEGAATYALDRLAPGPDGRPLPWPATSPENTYVAPDGLPAALGPVPTSDGILLRVLTDACADVLHPAPAWLGELARRTARLPAERVAPDGTLAEWGTDVTAVDPHHRHTTHLVGLFPFATLDTVARPDLAAAAARTLEDRGGESTGWALAWRTALEARLGRADAAAANVARAVRPARDDAGAHRGGLYPSLLSAHPPFQVDGNLALTAGVLEMLVGTVPGRLDLLGALPSQWPDGEVHGVAVPGGVVVDMVWEAGRLVRATLRGGPRDTVLHVRHHGACRTVPVPAGATVALDADLSVADPELEAPDVRDDR
ncbi:glycoside hydrolase N-terminal domain-containing protein [Flavimobilis sp. GY10621]|uniref:Glycoside hydrolase N-terminal domain-containing protein n=1 Tax=Flavimobilis rhizosphaerae TaxID=2775421 RepID=A0ABR9DNC7_9MICO|nr:glycoside hydrolase N-terminal domain-containing protein [Flavimobilis rhizosphaerae]MBD9698488.1 glycoside hydrolase N-terminal domain-containing protein [Flavimobilis rhizosphaerae]